MSPATIDLAIRASVDAAKAEAGLNSIGDAAGRMADDVSAAAKEADRASRSLDGIADSADGVATKGSILAGAMGDIGGGLEAAGLGGFGSALEALSTPLMFAAGLGDLLAVSMESLKLATLKETAASVANKAVTVATTAAQKAQVGVQWALNAAMSANPIALVVIAAVALIAGLVLLYKHSSRFRAIVHKVGEIGRRALGFIVDKASALVGWFKDRLPSALGAMKSVAVAAFNAIPIVFLIRHAGDVVRWFKDKIPAAFNHAKDIAVKAFDLITAPIRALIGFVQDLIDKIQNIHWPEPPGWVKDLGGAIGNIFNRPSISGPSSSTAAPVTIATTPAAPAITYQITVQGAVDPDSTAKQIEKLLNKRAVRIGAPR